MFVPVEVNVIHMKINNADHGGAVSFGTNVKANRNVSAKKTQGFGQQLADCVLRVGTVQSVWDEDLSDAFSIKINAR